MSFVSGVPGHTPQQASASPYDALVFAGGGCRCFWQAGFYGVVGPSLGVEPEVVTAASAGAAFACAVLLGRQDVVLRDFKERASQNLRNWYPRNWIRGETVFPHEEIYRGTMEATISDSDFKRLRDGPDIRILLARPPRWADGRLGFALAALAYTLDQSPALSHLQWPMRFGFVPEVVSLRDCPSLDALVELILHSSCTPPLLPLYQREGRTVLDGGLVDNVPADFVGPARSTLVMLSRHHHRDELPQHPQRTYVGPSQPIPIDKWDYTSPSLVDQTYDLGRRDGEDFLNAFDSKSKVIDFASFGETATLPIAG